MTNFENIRLEKGMYTNGKTFTETLEALDPSENYRGSAFEGLDAYQRQLKRFNIRTAGKNSDTIEKFFSTSDSAVLFPEFISRTVRAGMESNSILPSIVASVTDINAMDYRTFSSNPDEEELELAETEEGENLPEANIVVNSELVSLKKRGRLLCASYEALRFQRLDLFSVMLRQIGAYMAKSQLKDAISVLKGSGSDSITSIDVATSGALTYSDLVHFWNSFDPYTMNTIIASPDMLEKILNMGVFNDSSAGLKFHANGEMITPFGAKLFKTSCLGEGTLIGLDSNCALEQIQAGGVLTEFDKLIDCQLERAAISSINGFSRIYKDASKMLSI